MLERIEMEIFESITGMLENWTQAAIVLYPDGSILKTKLTLKKK